MEENQMAGIKACGREGGLREKVKLKESGIGCLEKEKALLRMVQNSVAIAF